MGASPSSSAQGIDARVVMPLYAGIPLDKLERLDGALRCGPASARRAARVRMSTLPRARCRSTFSSTITISIGPTLTPARSQLSRQPLSASRTCRAARSSSAGAIGFHSRHRSRQRLADRARPRLSQHGGVVEPLHGSAASFDSQPRLPRGCGTRGRSHHGARTQSTNTLASRALRDDETSRRPPLPQHAAQHGEPHLRRENPDLRARIRPPTGVSASGARLVAFSNGIGPRKRLESVPSVERMRLTWRARATHAFEVGDSR